MPKSRSIEEMLLSLEKRLAQVEAALQLVPAPTDCLDARLVQRIQEETRVIKGDSR